jgi:hypothetical protein
VTTNEERDPIVNPQQGDILQCPNGVYVLVDYLNGSSVGFMASDEVTGRYYLKGWSNWMKDSIVIERGAPETWSYTSVPTREESTVYLRQRIYRNGPT